MSVKHFANERHAIVTEALDGAVLASGGALVRLDGYPNIKVAVRADWDRSRVALVSGGGSGHEPAHVGFVGRGMLTAAVCGEIFASPSVDAVLAAILAVSGPAGCLLIVKNYTGDRLNFGLAAERARARGILVETVIVGDDVATAGARPRGVAGTVVVHKAAGCAAEAGAPLPQVRAAAEHAEARVASLGLSLSTCSVPGSPAEARMGEAEVELGLGIHGEPGMRTLPIVPADELVGVMLGCLQPHIDAEAPLGLLVNNLGGLPPIELALVTRALLLSPLGSRVELLVGPAPMMTALDMKGLSITAIALDAALRGALTAPTDAPGWPGVRAVGPLRVMPLPAGLETARHAASTDARARGILTAACGELVAREGPLNALDAKVGDGDTGTTFATAARAILRGVDELPLADPAALCRAISERLAAGMGGSSGVLLAIFSAAAADALGDGLAWPAALRKGLARMQEYGGAGVGDRTMVDALSPAIDALAEGGGLAEAAAAAERGAAATERIVRTGAGRSSYLAEAALAGVRDPGAAAIAFVLARLAASRPGASSGSEAG